MREVIPVGTVLREFRRRRRMTQLGLAEHADISARHLSFIETGRSHPSRDMLLRLSERLQLSLRERNVLLTAAGFSAAYSERPLADPELAPVRQAMEIVLEGHKPFPAFAVDHHWTLLASNGGFTPFLTGMEIDATLLEPPINVLRLTLHPGGMASHLANYHQWRSHVLDRLRAQILVSGDPVLRDLFRELRDYPEIAASGYGGPVDMRAWHALVIPFQLVTEGKILSFYSTTTVFGTPMEVTLSEISIESFYPADTATREALTSREV
jgi:transcriptional regulator with XRE-family HTH domain